MYVVEEKYVGFERDKEFCEFWKPGGDTIGNPGNYSEIYSKSRPVYSRSLSTQASNGVAMAKCKD